LYLFLVLPMPRISRNFIEYGSYLQKRTVARMQNSEAATSENSVESDWQRVEYLEELAQWLYYHELPLQDCIDLLHWAVDITLSLRIQLPSWLEPPKTEGAQRHYSVSFILILWYMYIVWGQIAHRCLT